MNQRYSNRNVKWILISGVFNAMGQSILWFSTSWLIYGLGGTNAKLGEILGIASLIGIFTTFGTSTLADHLRKDLIIWIGTIVTITGSYILAISNTITEVFIGQIIMSLGSSAAFPIITALFADSIPAKDRNRVFGTQFLVTNIFTSLGNIIGYFIFRNLTTVSIKELDTDLIRFSILIATIVQLIAFLGLLKVRDKYIIKQRDEGTVASNFNEGVNKVELEKFFNRDDFAPYSIRIISYSLVSSYLIGFGAGITIPYLGRFFFDIYEINLANLSLLFAIMEIITGIWGKINSNLADKYGRIELIVFNQMISVSLLFLLSSYPPIQLALLTLIVRNAAMNGTGPIASAVQMEFAPRKYRSRVNALNVISWAVFFSIGQIIGGRLVDTYGFRLPIIITATLYFIASIFYWKIKALSLKSSDYLPQNIIKPVSL